jgi:hypothetical protein
LKWKKITSLGQCETTTTTMTEMTFEEKTEIEAFYYEHFWEQVRLRATQDALEIGFVFDEQYKSDLLDDWMDERPNPPFVQAHLPIYLELLRNLGVDEGLNENDDAERVFELAMSWWSFTAVHEKWFRCPCGCVEIAESEGDTLCSVCDLNN